MRIHTDKITYADAVAAVAPGVYIEATNHGSRKRDHALEVSLYADEGRDAHGILRAYATNSGTRGALPFTQNTGYRAATWIEWGDWMVALFKIDPSAIIGPYEGWSDFVDKTARYAPHRPTRESAITHAERWERELVASEPWTVPA